MKKFFALWIKKSIEKSEKQKKEILALKEIENKILSTQPKMAETTPKLVSAKRDYVTFIDWILRKKCWAWADEWMKELGYITMIKNQGMDTPKL